MVWNDLTENSAFVESKNGQREKKECNYYLRE